MGDMQSYQQQLQLRIMKDSRRRDLQQRAASQIQQQGMLSPSAQNGGGYSNSTSSQPTMQNMQPRSRTTGSAYDDLPINLNDIDTIVDRDDADTPSFESACQHGPLSAVQSIVSAQNPPRTRYFLHHGLVAALRAGNTDIARYLFSVGAPIVRQTPHEVLHAPSDRKLSLFEFLVNHGWTVNTPGYYGAVLLPEMVADLPLLHWFLDHGADLNLGRQRDYSNRHGRSATDSCAALEAAVKQGNVAAASLLLDAGAEIQYGNPLHCAAGACPPSTNPHVARVTPGTEFDQSRIPVMALLVERGTDVNQMDRSRQMVPRYAIVHAVMAGAVERVKWLLEQGADPELKGAWGSAVTYAKSQGSEEMISVVEEAVRARNKVGDI